MSVRRSATRSARSPAHSASRSSVRCCPRPTGPGSTITWVRFRLMPGTRPASRFRRPTAPPRASRRHGSRAAGSVIDAANSAFVTAMHYAAFGSAIVAVLGVLVVLRWLPARSGASRRSSRRSRGPAATDALPAVVETDSSAMTDENGRPTPPTSNARTGRSVMQSAQWPVGTESEADMSGEWCRTPSTSDGSRRG